MTVRLIATDLDGTIVRFDGTISTRTRAALAAAEDAGIVVAFVTGRPPDALAPIVEATGHRGLAVCSNGAVLYDLHTEAVLEEFPIDAEVARALTTAIRDVLPEISFATQGPGWFEHERGFVPNFDLPADIVETTLEHLVRRPVVKLLAHHPTLPAADLLDQARDVVGELAELLSLTFGNPDYGMIELSAAGVTKAFALERLAASHGITAEEVVAFGDMRNDLPMLQWAGHGVAVANAHPNVLGVADEITAHVDDDGVAIVVERIVQA